MPQYYTLEEAASKLNMSPDELREMAKQKKVRAFQDKGSWRFRSQEIDEMARERGLGSDPELKLGEAAKAVPKPGKSAPKPPPPDEGDRIAIDFNLDSGEAPIGKEKPTDKSPSSRTGKSGPRSPSPKAAKGDSDVRLVMDSNLDFQIELDSDVRLEESGPKSSSKMGGPRKSKLQPGDSSVRLVGDKPSDSDVKVVPSASDKSRSGKSKVKNPSDSDIRLHEAGQGGKKKKGEAGSVTEEIIDLDAEQAKLEQKPSASGKRPRVTQAGNAPLLPTTSPFELSENDINLDTPPRRGSKSPAKSKADTDSSSDFDLVAFDSSKAPSDLGSGEIPLLAGDEDVSLGDLAGPGAGNSGINLQDPADSGISLEDGSGDEIEFELSLDSGAGPRPTPAKPAARQPAAKPPEEDDSSSEFELSLDDAPSDPSSSEFELSLDDDSSADSSSSEFELSLDDDAKEADSSSSEFELSLDSSESSDSIGLQGEGSDSEFELSLDEDGGLGSLEDEPGKDIFEPTNFDVPALDDESGSEAVAIDEATDMEDSDFEISLDGDEDASSGSQVVALDDEEADDAAATVAKPRKTAAKSKLGKGPIVVEDEEEAALDLDLDTDDGAPKKKRKLGVDEDEDESGEVATVAAPPAEWGALPVMLLFPTMIVLFVVCLMGYELVQGMFGYNRPAKVSKLVLDPIARLFDDNLPKE